MKNTIAFILLFLIVVFVQLDADAQCAMCKATIESNEEGVGGGINKGILFMMPIPYAIIGVVGYWIYRRKKDKDDNDDIENS